MDKQLRIILTYQDQATAGLSRSIGAIQTVTTKGMTGLTGAVQGIPGIVGGAISKVTRFFTGMVSHFRWASLFIGSMAVGMGAKLLGIAANAEQTRVAFETLLKSPKQAGEFMTWIEDLSIKTPLMRSELENAAKTFLAYSMPLETAKRALMVAVEATSALGLADNKLARISVNLGQIYNSQKVREMELKELRLAGVQVNRIFTDAIKDGTIKIQGQGNAMTVTGGASKKLTTAYGKATESTKELNDKLAISNQKLKELDPSSKTYKSRLMSLNNQIQNYNEKIVKNNSVVAEFTTAQAGAGKVIKQTAGAIKEVDEETLKWIKDNMTGKEVFEILEKGMLKLYGGASIRQVQTFSGSISNFGDVFAKVLKRAMGISSDGTVQIGGAFDKIRNAAAKMIEYLIDNVDEIGKFFNKLLSNKDTLIALAGILGGMLFGAFWGLIVPVTLMGVIFGGLAVGATKLVDKMGGLNNIIKKAREAWQDAQPAFRWIVDNKNSIIGAIMGITTTIALAMIPTIIKSLDLLVLRLRVAMLSFNPWVAALIILGAVVGIVIANWDKLSDSIGGIALVITAVVLPAIFVLRATLINLWPVIATNPIGALIFAAGLLAAGFIYLSTQTDLLKTSSDLLTEAHRRVKDAQDAEKQSGQQLADAKLNLRGSVLAERDAADQLTTAQNNVNEAKRIYGENSPQWVEANKNLERATYNHDVQVSQLQKDQVAVTDAQIKNSEKSLARIAEQEKEAEAVKKHAEGWQTLIEKIGGAISKLGEYLRKQSTFGGIGIAGFGPLGKQHGGIVPGQVGQPVPIMAHGGERITPRGSNREAPFGGGGGVTINMTGPVSMDSPQRVKELADTIIKILGRQNELAKWGVGF